MVSCLALTWKWRIPARGYSWLASNCSCSVPFATSPGEAGHTSELFNYTPHSGSLSTTLDFGTDDQKAFPLTELQVETTGSPVFSDFIDRPRTNIPRASRLLL